MKPAEDLPNTTPQQQPEPAAPTAETAREPASTLGHVEQGPELEEKYSDCIELIQRVKQHSPDCLVEPLRDWTDPAPVDLSELPESELPRQIGRFQIQSMLGVGGFGLVYRAYDPQLDRVVALKIPRLETLLAKADRERFLREARTASSLDHPQLATIYEAGQAGPICYIASACYGGGTLHDMLRDKGPLPVRTAARLVQALARAMQHAHSRGVLHRDIKPSNVLFDDSAAGDGEPDALVRAARITDFGLARSLDQDQKLTLTGTLIGTPAYMSPEQAESRQEDISTASDIYSLGAVLYELLSGQPPHERENLLATLEAVRSADPQPLSRLAPHVPRDLAAICQKCLHKEPARRYASAHDLAEDLERWLSGRAVEARPLATRQRLLRWGRRHPALSALLATVVLGVSAVAAVSSFAYFRVQQARDELADANVQLRESLDAQVSIVLEDLLSRQTQLTPAHRKYLQSALDSYEQFARHQGNTRQARRDVAQAYARVGDIHTRLGQHQAAVSAYQTAIEKYDDLARDAGPDTRLVLERSQVIGSLAQLLRNLEQISESESLLRRSITELQQLAPAESAQREEAQHRLAAQMAVLGTILKNSQRLDESGHMLRDALAIQEQLVAAHGEVGDYRLDQSNMLGSLAQTTLRQGRADEAKQLMARSRDSAQQLVHDFPDQQSYQEAHVRSLNGLAVLSAQTGDMPQAESLFREMLAARRDMAARYPANLDYQQELIVAYSNLGALVAQQGAADEAAQLWRDGESVARRLLTLNSDVPLLHCQLAALLLHLAQLRIDAGDIAQAVAYVEEGRGELDVALAANPHHPMFQHVAAEQHLVAAMALSLAGRHDEAAEAARHVLQHPLDPARAPMEAARVFARGATHAGQTEDATLQGELQQQAVGALRQAVRHGYRDSASIAQNADFSFLSPEQLQELFAAQEKAAR